VFPIRIEGTLASYSNPPYYHALADSSQETVYRCIIDSLSYQTREAAMAHLKFAHDRRSYDSTMIREREL